MLFYIIKKEKGNPKNIYKILKAKNRIKKLELFDEEFYLKKYPKAKSSINPLDHYLYHGYKEWKQPSQLFNNNYYLNKYFDVKKSGKNPLIHYVLYGKKEGRFPNKKSENDSLENLQKTVKEQDNEIKSLKKEIKKYSKIYKYKSINKEKITSEIENFKEYGVTKEKRTQKLIVSLTSCPDRLYDVHYTIYSLLKQTCLPDEVILWLSREEFPNLGEDIPKKILELEKHGLTIKWCKNLKSYKKLIFALQEYPNDIIITADDDLYYPEKWLEKLYNEYNNNPENIICHRAHLIKFDNNEFKPYITWKQLIQNNEASFLNFTTTGGGTLYPPKSLYSDVLDENLFMKLAPSGDDIWFWAMAVLNSKKIKIIEDGYNHITYVNPEREANLTSDKTLYHKNKKGRNDQQLKNIVEKYPKIITKLKYASSTKISVIIPVYNTEKYLEKCLDSVVKQTIKDIEIICVNDESTDNSLKILEKYAKKDKRIKIIKQTNQGVSIARNTGLKIAKGEYIGFVDSDDWIDLDFYEKLYDEAKGQGADLARTFYKYNYPDKETYAGLNKLIKNKKSKNELLTVNNHSVVIWNAIYRRKYLQKNKIDYFDDIFGANDVPFTARATYFSKKSVPVVGTYYHYRKEVKNSLTLLTLKRIKCMWESNKITINFINSVEYSDVKDYLIAFKRCMWRYHNIFHRTFKIKEFDEENQMKFFNDFVKEYKKCKYLEKLKKDYYEPYFDYLDRNSFKEYLNYKTKKMKGG